jgi:acyl-CoA thioesterase-1
MRSLRHVFVELLIALVVFGGCRSRESSGVTESGTKTAAAPVEHGRAVDAVPRPRIVVLGDSLTAGFGLAPEQSFPAILQTRIDDAHLEYEIVNAGVSGDTSAGGLRRLDWALDGDVSILIVALGANDGLRGLPADELRRNLGEIVERAQARGAVVILAGMEAPPNLGPIYTQAFRDVYNGLAKEYGVHLIPFLLDPVAGLESLNQRDGVHPNAQGARQVADHVWATLRPIAEAHRRAHATEP